MVGCTVNVMKDFKPQGMEFEKLDLENYIFAKLEKVAQKMSRRLLTIHQTNLMLDV